MEWRTKFDEWYMNKEKNNWELFEVKILFFPIKLFKNFSLPTDSNLTPPISVSHKQLNILLCPEILWRNPWHSKGSEGKIPALNAGTNSVDISTKPEQEPGAFIVEKFILVLRAIKQGPVVTVGKSWEWVIFQNEALLKGFQVTWMHKMAGSVRLFENNLKGIILRLLVSLGWHYDPDHASWELLGNQL